MVYCEKERKRMVEDHLKLYRSLKKEKVKYIIIGGVAAIAYGVPRTTNDIDIFIEPTAENCRRLLKAMNKAGLVTATLTTPLKVSKTDLTVINDFIRMDIMTKVKGLKFDDCWARRKIKKVNSVPVNFISLQDLILSKSKVARKSDKDDISLLRRIKKERL